jgi:hypothetical protein
MRTIGLVDAPLRHVVVPIRQQVLHRVGAEAVEIVRGRRVHHTRAFRRSRPNWHRLQLLRTQRGSHIVYSSGGRRFLRKPRHMGLQVQMVRLDDGQRVARVDDWAPEASLNALVGPVVHGGGGLLGGRARRTQSDTQQRLREKLPLPCRVQVADVDPHPRVAAQVAHAIHERALQQRAAASSIGNLLEISLRQLSGTEDPIVIIAAVPLRLQWLRAITWQLRVDRCSHCRRLRLRAALLFAFRRSLCRGLSSRCVTATASFLRHGRRRAHWTRRRRRRMGSFEHVVGFRASIFQRTCEPPPCRQEKSASHSPAPSSSLQWCCCSSASC